MKSFNITEFIRLVVISLLLLWGFFLVKPFIGILAWAVILAVALFPLYKKVRFVFGEKHQKKASTLFSIILVTLLIVPTYSAVSSLFSSVNATLTAIDNNELKITPPTEKVKEWPVLGTQIYDNWKSFSENSKQYTIDHKEMLMEKGSAAVKSFTGILGTVFSFLLSLIIALIFMSNATGAFKTASEFTNKLVGGKKGVSLLLMARDTIRNVVKGILFVALVQAFFAYLGFKFIGLPAPSIFAFIVMLSAIIQVPVTLVVLPTVFMAFSIEESTVTATVFSVYIIIISLLDNFLKPILLAKGLKTPMVLIIIGALGGMMLHGIIGIFIGTVLLAVLHQLYMTWLSSKADVVIKE
ncbi:putative PurR-regulated permease PerM [Jejuia pallidilutea]|uniref:Putative PurR-regulated permease PerM n=1 Tax=Jejuia pallidilutea TaxID=504487 RepID=A0A362X712_9FLAO|nr:AI-2E family transporter [Jejuia pallidilutea]PQV46945.1 putative PurR-regulated permease PerM [Jejuia pallidilutea]